MADKSCMLLMHTAQFKLCKRFSISQADVLLYVMILIAHTTLFSSCHSFTPSPKTIIQPRRSNSSQISLFRDLISNDDEDLRVDIAVIKEQVGLDNFLKEDDRLCVIKLYAPFCKACKAFGVKFRKVASERGDRLNAAREIVQYGKARFGEIEYSSNVKLCKALGINKFPSVLIFRGGNDGGEKLTEIECKQKLAIDDIISELDQFLRN